LGADGGAGAGFSTKGGWREEVGLSTAVSAGEDPPLPKARLPRPARAVRGDGDNPEPSDPPSSGESWARCLPFLTPACGSLGWLRRNSRRSVFDSARRSVFPVVGLRGIRLHPCFLLLHRLHGPFGTTSQTWPAFAHRVHCHRPLAPSQLRERRHTWTISPSEICSTGSSSLLLGPCSAGTGLFPDRARRFAVPRGPADEPFRFLVVAAPLVTAPLAASDLPRL
jgi:hypothetical protein